MSNARSIEGEPAVNTIRWETIPEPTRQFIRSIVLSPEGAIIEEDGRPSYRVIAYPKSSPDAMNSEWTPADNQLRCDLIDKQIDGVITPDERVLLESLQQRLSNYVNKVAPLPLEQLRKMHHELLEKAAKTNGPSSA
jgi:hypothetical protein